MASFRWLKLIPVNNERKNTIGVEEIGIVMSF